MPESRFCRFVVRNECFQPLRMSIDDQKDVLVSYGTSVVEMYSLEALLCRFPLVQMFRRIPSIRQTGHASQSEIMDALVDCRPPDMLTR